MLPALAIFVAYAAYRFARVLKDKRPVVAGMLQPLALVLVVLNLGWMIAESPIVWREAYDSSRQRLTVELPLATELAKVKKGTPILIDNWGFDGAEGALERAGVPLAETIGPRDGSRWQVALAAPARSASYAVGTDGSAIMRAVKAHPEGLTEVAAMCRHGMGCVRVYRSDVYPTQ